ncbi:MAG: hypothetical protein HQL88_05850 [Magnetococcales bacterium]|nr:hypothetical protein [Magnetococcales bacterium]
MLQLTRPPLSCRWMPSGRPVGVLLWVIVFLLTGCQQEQKQESTYLALDTRGRDRLPLSPHVLTNRARPSATMAVEHPGLALRFRALDKRTLKIHNLVASVGQRQIAPWGALYASAFVPDLVIRDGQALHGPEGYFNPAVWVVLEDGNGQPLHEGWLFARDSAQTAWDHARYDLTFLGSGAEEAAAAPGKRSTGGAAPNTPRKSPATGSTPRGARDEAAESVDDLQDPQD